jgi:hypothetical protein
VSNDAETGRYDITEIVKFSSDYSSAQVWMREQTGSRQVKHGDALTNSRQHDARRTFLQLKPVALEDRAFSARARFLTLKCSGRNITAII